MKPVSIFLRILLWESVQNIAPIVGFAYATYQWLRNRQRVAITIIVLSTILGSIAISVTEPLIYGQPANLAWSWDILFNIIMFTGLSIVAMLFIDWKKDPKWDLAVSIGCGTVLAVGQAIVDPFSGLGIAAHILSMSVSFYVFLRFARWAIRTSNDKVVLWRAFLINMIGSIIIVMIDYGYLIIGVDL